MKRFYLAILLVILSPIIIVISLYLVTGNIQPENVTFSQENYDSVTTYIQNDRLYNFCGDILVNENTVSDPEHFDFNNAYAVTSLSEVKNSSRIVEDKYIDTFYFLLNLANGNEYALWIPTEYTDYRIFVNGENVYDGESFKGTSVSFPSSFMVTLPINEEGRYEVIMNATAPANYTNSGSSAILFGTSAKVAKDIKSVKKFSICMSAFILVTMCFSLIQILVLKNDTSLLSFVILSFMTFLLMSFMDGRIITIFIPRLPYQIGCFMEAIMTPLFLLSLLYYTQVMFPNYFSKFISYIFGGLLTIPFINALCLNRFSALSSASIMVTVIPYAMCLYIFVLAYERREKYAMLFGIGVLAMESSVLLYYATSDFPIPSRFTYSIGYAIMAITMVATTAEGYISQEKAEEFYTRELSIQLETMQASENAFLNAQMKPHFLYNTLNTIADCCVTDPAKAKSLINSLSEYLKLILSLDNMDKTVPLRRELELAEAYTAIEKERFPSINFYTDFPLRLPNIMMPPITIQPLIENAIKHGVRKSDKPGVVTLRLVEHTEYVEFFVSDNGVGMTEEQIGNLFREPKENQSIGIYNIDKRLKNIYNMGLTVESTPGLGTCVSFKIYKYFN